MDDKNEILLSLKNFVINTNDIEQSNKIIENIFDLHFKFKDKKNILSDISMHLSEVFNFNPAGLFLYFSSNENFSTSDLGIENSKYKNYMKTLNKIKFEYGFFVKKLMSIQQMPFMINFLETNIANGQTIHKIKLSRNDGETFEAVFNPDILMNLTTGMIGALNLSMQQGIYNINTQTLENYLKSTKEFNKYLESIISSGNNDTLKSIAADKHE